MSTRIDSRCKHFGSVRSCRSPTNETRWIGEGSMANLVEQVIWLIWLRRHTRRMFESSLIIHWIICRYNRSIFSLRRIRTSCGTTEETPVIGWQLTMRPNRHGPMTMGRIRSICNNSAEPMPQMSTIEIIESWTIWSMRFRTGMIITHWMVWTSKGLVMLTKIINTKTETNTSFSRTRHLRRRLSSPCPSSLCDEFESDLTSRFDRFIEHDRRATSQSLLRRLRWTSGWCANGGRSMITSSSLTTARISLPCSIAIPSRFSIATSNRWFGHRTRWTRNWTRHSMQHVSFTPVRSPSMLIARDAHSLLHSYLGCDSWLNWHEHRMCFELDVSSRSFCRARNGWLSNELVEARNIIWLLSTSVSVNKAIQSRWPKASRVLWKFWWRTWPIQVRATKPTLCSIWDNRFSCNPMTTWLFVGRQRLDGLGLIF